MSTIIIEVYQTESGKKPFYIWLKNLDGSVRARIRTRIDRLLTGNFGDCNSVDHDLWELRFHFGPGYRVYFGKIKDKVVLLLNAGDKGTQNKDIEKAKEYWKDYKNKESL